MQAFSAARNNQQVADSSGHSLRFFRFDRWISWSEIAYKLFDLESEREDFGGELEGESETNYEG